MCSSFCNDSWCYSGVFFLMSAQFIRCSATGTTTGYIIASYDPTLTDKSKYRQDKMIEGFNEAQTKQDHEAKALRKATMVKYFYVWAIAQACTIAAYHLHTIFVV